MYEIIGQLRCPKCTNFVEMDEKVILDNMNTILHLKCYFKSSHPYSVKDQGTFHKMILKYNFFNEYTD